MLIPFTDLDPTQAAKDCCDKHVVKLILEIYQGLEHYIDRDPKRGYYNHPFSKWIRESEDNARWAKMCFIALLNQYKQRYKKDHSYTAKLEKLESIDIDKYAARITNIPFGSVDHYRSYFQRDKSRFATWRSPASKPKWWLAATKHDTEQICLQTANTGA